MSGKVAPEPAPAQKVVLDNATQVIRRKSFTSEEPLSPSSEEAVEERKRYTKYHAREPEKEVFENKGEDDIVDTRRPTFIYKTEGKAKHYYFAPVAFGGVGINNPVRKFFIHVIVNKWFDRTILVLILVNSIIMAMTDYAFISDEYEPISDGSWRNALAAKTEVFFVVAFSVEMVSKIIGMGFYMEKYPPGYDSDGVPDTYLRDSWNNLDFVVVLSGWASFIPGLPNVSVIRTFRVLRPLKSVSGLEGVKMVIVAVTNSIPELMSVIVLLMFVFAIFGILGLQFFLGMSHTRCRLTPYPVTLDWVQGMDYAQHKCLTQGLDWDDDSTRKASFSTMGDQTWTKAESPWFDPRPCYWPLDQDDERLCSFEDGSGMHECYHGDYHEKYVKQFNPDKPETWCGSNWDALGNGRFAAPLTPVDIYGQDHELYGRVYGDADFKWSANFAAGGTFMFGFMDFDNFARAMATIFQTITLEGWTDIMYMLQDAYDPVMTGAFFVVLVSFGSFFVLQLLLAVLENNYNEEEQKMTAKKLALQAAEETAAAEAQIDAFVGMSDEEVGRQIDERAGWDADFPMGEMDFEGMLEEMRKDFRPQGPCGWAFGWCFLDPESEEASQRPPWRQALFNLVESPNFGLMITFCIILNTACLACDQHPMDDSLEAQLEVFNFIFTVVFVCEMCLKIPGLGIRRYMSDTFNVFDFTIVTVSIVETISSPPSFLMQSDGASPGGGISALRSFRLFRIFKLARQWDAMRQLLDLIVKTAYQMGNFMLLFCIFVYIYALLGMQFFAGRMHFDDMGYAVPITEGGNEAYRAPWKAAEIPRSNFDTLVWACTTIFGILTGENWNAVMYDGMRAAGWGAIFYFVTLIVFGQFIVMNIFMAILLANFDELGKSEGPAEEGGEPPPDASGKVAQDPNPPKTPGGSIRKSIPPTAAQELHDSVRNIAKNGPATQLAAAISAQTGTLKSNFGGPEQPAVPMLHYADATKGPEKKPPASKTGIPPTNSAVRLVCRKIVTRKWFDNGILVCIILSSVTLAVDNPLNDPGTFTSQALFVLDWVMTIIFSVEMALKIIGLGLWGHDEAYLTNGWNLLDGVIVIVGWIGLVADESLSAFKALRALRALKPLRMINRYPGLQVVVGTMISSIGAIANVAIVTLLVFLIFAIMSVNYLKGKFFACQGDAFDSIAGTPMEAFLTEPKQWEHMTPVQKGWFQAGSSVANFGAVGSDDGALGCEASGDGLAHCCPDIDWDSSEAPTSRAICACWGMDWGRVIYQNFDNTWVALGCLYEISTTEGWIDVMLAAVDAPNAIDMQPITNNNESWIGFFILYMVIGSFLMTNLFVGVIIQNFNDLKEEKDKESAASGAEHADLFLTEDQRMWQMTQKLLAQMLDMQFHRPTPPKTAWFGLVDIRRKAFQCFQHPTFDNTIVCCIIANCIVMAISYFGMGDEYSFFLDLCNFTFAMVFNCECIIKLLALGKGYFYNTLGTRVVLNNWNIFDFTIVLGTNIGLVVSPPFDPSASGAGGVVTVVRMFRIGRLLRLINGAASIKKMFDTLIMTLPGLANVAAVVFLLFFIFAVIGVQLFATVAYHESLSPHANFRTFGMAFMTLLRFSTGENWNGFMYEAAHNPATGWHDTEGSLESDGSGKHAAKGEGSGWCDPDVQFEDHFSGGPWDGMKYGDVMCGFATHASVYAQQSDGCVELNGCGNFIIFPYLQAFTLLITFVFLNLFVGIILDGFDQAEQGGEASTISEPEFLKIWAHWVNVYDPEETYCIDIWKVKSFLQTLHAPWGFGLDYVASDAELIYRVKDLNLTVGEDGTIHFFKVLKGLSRRAISLAKKADMEQIDHMETNSEQVNSLSIRYSHLPNFSMDLARSFREPSKPKKEAGFGSMMSTSAVEMEDLVHVLARMIIKRQLKIWVNKRRLRQQALRKSMGGSLTRGASVEPTRAGAAPAGADPKSAPVEKAEPVAEAKPAAELLPGFEM